MVALLDQNSHGIMCSCIAILGISNKSGTHADIYITIICGLSIECGAHADDYRVIQTWPNYFGIKVLWMVQEGPGDTDNISS